MGVGMRVEWRGMARNRNQGKYSGILWNATPTQSISTCLPLHEPIRTKIHSQDRTQQLPASLPTQFPLFHHKKKKEKIVKTRDYKHTFLCK